MSFGDTFWKMSWYLYIPTMQTVISPLPPPILTIQVVPLGMPWGSGPSTHIVPLGMPRGSGSSTYTIPPVIHGWEAEPHQLVERNKFLNHCDEAFGYLCSYISRDLLFHLEGLRTPRESWEKLDSLFNKQYELWRHILENELVSLNPSSFNTIEQFFSKFKSLVLQCR